MNNNLNMFDALGLLHIKILSAATSNVDLFGNEFTFAPNLTASLGGTYAPDTLSRSIGIQN